jgi:hypothetical protein
MAIAVFPTAVGPAIIMTVLSGDFKKCSIFNVQLAILNEPANPVVGYPSTNSGALSVEH